MKQYAAQAEQLNAALKQNRLSHAYLLSGVAGLGKTQFALDFAKTLLSSDPFQHPDFMMIRPEEKGHSIKIDQIRELTDKLSRTAHKGGYQIAIIAPADAMPTGAANALLKTLEEPQGKVILFLIDDQAHELPKTILSRCQKIYFSPDNNAFSGIDHELFEMVFAHIQAIVTHTASDPISPVVSFAKQDLMMMLNVILAAGIHLSREHYAGQNIHISIAALHDFLQMVCEKKKLVASGINLNAQLCLENIFIELSVSGSSEARLGGCA